MKDRKSNALIFILFLSLRTIAQPIKSLLWISDSTYVLKLRNFKILTDPMLGPKSKESFRIKIHPSTVEPNAAIERYYEPAQFEKKQHRPTHRYSFTS